MVCHTPFLGLFFNKSKYLNIPYITVIYNNCPNYVFTFPSYISNNGAKVIKLLHFSASLLFIIACHTLTNYLRCAVRRTYYKRYAHLKPSRVDQIKTPTSGNVRFLWSWEGLTDHWFIENCV